MGATHSTQAAASLITANSITELPPGECPMHQKTTQQGAPSSGHHHVAMQGVGGGVAQCPMREGSAPAQSTPPQGWVSECPASVGQESQALPADFDPRNMVGIFYDYCISLIESTSIQINMTRINQA